MKKYEGNFIFIKGEKYTLSINYDLSGELAYWIGEKYSIVATPLFDGISVPVDVLDYNGCVLDYDVYRGQITCFESYCTAVIIIAGVIIKNMEMV